MSPLARCLIIVPAFNEELNVGKTVLEIQAMIRGRKDPHRWDADVLIVDDGSQDKTRAAALASGVSVVTLPFNLGIGGAVQTGFQWADRLEYDTAVQVDGDGQHDARYLEDILLPILNNAADMVIGSRFLPPHLGYQSSWVRRVGIIFFSRLISFLTGEQVTDPTSGFRAYNRKMIRVFASYYPSDFPEPEAIVVARRARARILEVPVEMRKRSAGHSSIRYFKTLYYMVKVTLAIFLNQLKRKTLQA